MNYKPFDLVKAKAGDLVSIHDASGTYKFTLNQGENASTYKHVFTMSPHNDPHHQFLILSDDDGRAVSGHTGMGVPSLKMAPKEVEYWVATGRTKDKISCIYSSNPVLSEKIATEELVNNSDIDNSTIQIHKITRYE